MKFALHFVLTFLFMSLYACQSKPEEAILGKWETDKKAMREEFEQEITKTAKENPIKAKTMEESLEALLDKIQLSYEFAADGTLTMLSQGNTTKGKWAISSDGKTLSTTDAANQKIEANILELNSKTMLLKFGTETYLFIRK